jgi:hypothetical protein
MKEEVEGNYFHEKSSPRFPPLPLGLLPLSLCASA